MAIYILTNPSHTVVDCVTKNRLISTLERKRRRLVVMTMTSLVEIISFVVHFINDTL